MAAGLGLRTVNDVLVKVTGQLPLLALVKMSVKVDAPVVGEGRADGL